jgi:DNA repair photolyase
MTETTKPVLPLFGDDAVAPARRLVRVTRQTHILTPSPTSPGVYGLDLTAGCLHGCPYCYIRSSPRWPGEGRVLFDPFSAANLEQALASLKETPRQVVLSPASDPLPRSREVRDEAVRVTAILLQRGIDVTIMTRGYVPRALSALLERYKSRARVEVGLTSLDRLLSRRLEPGAASPRARLRGLARLVKTGVPVSLRLEPLFAGLTDTRENVAPLFDEAAARGVERVVAHYAFLHPAMVETLRAALAPIGWDERILEEYDEGPHFRVGSLGRTTHLPVQVRREGLARIIAWGAERGLRVETGSTQNPDFPRAHAPGDSGVIKAPLSATPAPQPG